MNQVSPLHHQPKGHWPQGLQPQGLQPKDLQPKGLQPKGHQPQDHQVFEARAIGRRMVMLASLVVILLSCTNDGVGPREPLTFVVIEGACGTVVFAERIGVDIASAMEVVEDRKAEQYGEGRVILDPHPLEVVDEHGNPPEPDFFALWVLDADTGFLVHSVLEVITTDGDLFSLMWCPD